MCCALLLMQSMLRLHHDSADLSLSLSLSHYRILLISVEKTSIISLPPVLLRGTCA